MPHTTVNTHCFLVRHGFGRSGSFGKIEKSKNRSTSRKNAIKGEDDGHGWTSHTSFLFFLFFLFCFGQPQHCITPQTVLLRLDLLSSDTIAFDHPPPNSPPRQHPPRTLHPFAIHSPFHHYHHHHHHQQQQQQQQQQEGCCSNRRTGILGTFASSAH